MPDAESLIKYGGLLLICLVVYASTGLFFCFFLPSGAVMFTAGVLTASGSLQNNIITVCVLVILSSVAGCVTGYAFGWRTGKYLHSRKDSRFFKRQHLTAAENFYTKYGAWALPLGFFLPVIRTFAPVMAGMIRLNFRRFFFLSLAGSAAWISSFVLTGYFFGSLDFIKPWLKYIVTGFLLIITLPLVLKIVKEMRKA